MKIRKKNIDTVFLAVCTILFFLSISFSLPYLIDRRHHESNNVFYVLCVEYHELVYASAQASEKILPVLKKFKDQAGVTAVALFQQVPGTGQVVDPAAYDGSGVFSDAAVQMIKQAGLLVCARPVNPRFISPDARRRRFTRQDLPPGTDIFLTSGDEVYGYPDTVRSTADILKERGISPGWIEFGGQKGGKALSRLCLQTALRTHSIDAAEMAGIPDRRKLIARYVRAVRERGVRMLYVHLLPEKDLDGNIRFIQSIMDRLKQHGFSAGRVSPVMSPRQGRRVMRQLLTWMIVWIYPVAGIAAGLLVVKKYRHRGNWLTAFASVQCVTISGCLAAAALQSIPEYMTGLYAVRGIKLSLLIPLAGTAAVLFNGRDLKKTFAQAVTWQAVCIMIGVLLVCMVFIFRSGNTALIFPAHGIERSAREFLEQWLGVRPRTKEFLIGHPALLVGLWWCAREKCSRIADMPVVGRMVLLIGAIGQVSIMNTFLHLHTPLNLSIIRTMHGLLIGTCVGFIVIGVVLCARHWCVKKT